MTGESAFRPGYSADSGEGCRGAAMSDQGAEATVRTSEEETVRVVPGAPPPPGRPRAVVVTTVLWVAALALGVVATVAVLARGGLSLDASAPDGGAEATLLVLIGLVFLVPRVALWFLLGRAVRRVAEGRPHGRPHLVLTGLAVLALVDDVLVVVSVPHALPITLCVLHAVVLLAALAVLWTPTVRDWSAQGRTVLVPADPRQGAAAGLPAGVVPAGAPRPPRPPRRPGQVAVGVLLGLVLAVGLTFVAMGGSARKDLEAGIPAVIAAPLGLGAGPASCSWGTGLAVALGAAHDSRCGLVLDGTPATVLVSSSRVQRFDARTTGIAVLPVLERRVGAVPAPSTLYGARCRIAGDTSDRRVVPVAPGAIVTCRGTAGSGAAAQTVYRVDDPEGGLTRIR